MALSAVVSLLQFPLFKLSPQNIAVYVSTMWGPVYGQPVCGPWTGKDTQAGPAAWGPAGGTLSWLKRGLDVPEASTVQQWEHSGFHF